MRQENRSRQWKDEEKKKTEILLGKEKITLKTEKKKKNRKRNYEKGDESTTAVTVVQWKNHGKVWVNNKVKYPTAHLVFR